MSSTGGPGQAAAASSSSSSLLNNVGYMGLQNLLNEPLRLKIESSRINKELDSLVLENYRLFIDNITSNAQIKNKDKKIGEESVVLKDNLSILSDQCNAFRERVNYFINSHKRNRKTLQHHMQILELLEVPQLVDACARNGFHDEALELANFINGLEKRHLLASEVKTGSRMDTVATTAGGGNGNTVNNNGNTVIQSIVDDVHDTLVSLRYQLLISLSDNSSLPKVLQILITLRKLDGLLIDRQIEIERRTNSLLSNLNDKSRDELKSHFVCISESRIQMDFLEARTLWLHRIVEKTLAGNGGVATSSAVAGELGQDGEDAKRGVVGLGPYGKAMELIEVYRASFFSIVQQFQSLFSENSSASGGSANCSPLLVLSTWVMHETSLLLGSLSVLLPRIEDGASIRNVYEQSLFLANRFSAIGCDITLLIMPIFKDNIVAKISSSEKSSLAAFKNMITYERFVSPDVSAIGSSNLSGPNSSTLVPLYAPSEGDDGSSAADGAPNNTPSKKGIADEVAPPMVLLAYPPIAFLLNAVLAIFNFIREVPINILQDSVLSHLDDFFMEMGEFIIENKLLLKNKSIKYLGSSDRSLDTMYAGVVLAVLVPQLLSSYDLIFHNDVGNNNKIAFNFNVDKIEKVSDAKKFLSANCFLVYEKLWNLFESKSLVPAFPK